MKTLTPEEVRKLLAQQGRRLRALEIHMKRLDASFEPGVVPNVPTPQSRSSAAVARYPEPVPMPQAPPHPTATPDQLQPQEDAPPSPLPAPQLPPSIPAYQAPAPLPLPMEEKKKRLEFLTESEAAPRPEAPRVHAHAQAPAPSAAPAQPRPAAATTLEQSLGGNWLLRIGGVLLLIGAAFGASLVQAYLNPALRVASGYLFAALLGATGLWVTRRHMKIGRTVQVIAVSLGYFVSFAAHYVPPTRVFEGSAIPSIVLMLGFGALIVVMAERWRSELVAGFGYFLAVIACLFCAGSSAGFTLVALGILTLSAGTLLLRNEWTRLTAFSLVGTYGTTMALWVLSPVERVPGAVLANLGALVMYHLVFAAAFWRWGRVWIARERLAEQELAAGTLPSFQMPILPYSRGFAVLNSLGLIALSTLLVYTTRIYWDNVHYLFFGLMALEALRLAIPSFRRTGLAGFHTVLVAGLMTAGIVSAFGGMTECTVLAMQALFLVVAGSRAKPLRWLSPLAGIPAGLTVVHFPYSGIVTLADYVGAVLPPAVLFASALPWKRWWTLRAPDQKLGVHDVFNALSAGVRSVTAGFLLAAGSFNYLKDILPIAIFLAAASAILVAGSLFLRARTWEIPAALYMIGAFACLSAPALPANPGVALMLAMVLGLGILWDLAARREALAAVTGVYTLLWLATGLVAPIGVYMLAGRFVPTAGFIFLAAILASIVAREATRDRRTLLGEGVTDPSIDPAATSLEQAKGYLRLSVMLLVALAVVGVATAITMDAPKDPWSCVAFSLLAFGYWVIQGVRRKLETPAAIAAAIGLSVGPLGLLVYTEGSLATLAGLIIGGWVFAGACMAMKRDRSLMIAMIYLAACVALTLLVQQDPANGTVSRVGLALVAVLSTLASPLLLGRKIQRALGEQLALVIRVLDPLLVALGIIATLTLLAKGVLFSGMFITLSWGVLGIALLFAGFLILNAPMRYSAMAVFALSIGRVFLFDLAGSSLATKVVAFLGLGILLIVAGIAYGALSKRLLKEQAPPGEVMPRPE